MSTLRCLSSCAVAALIACGCHSEPESGAPAAPTTTAVAKVTPTITSGRAQPRRMVKVAMDPEASQIDLAPKATTIEEIVSQSVPSQGVTSRVGPFETSVWKVKATLKSVQLMKDGDYYLVMRGDKGGETVVEVPDPAQCKGSPLEKQIASARKDLESRYHPTATAKALNEPATVTGVGFLGWGGTSKGGKARSGPRLMPGTGFEFGKAGG